MGKKIKVCISAAIIIVTAVIAVGTFYMQQSHDVYESELFIEFVEKCESEGNFVLRDESGNPVPQEKSKEFQAFYEERDYRKMQEFLVKNNYSLGYEENK